MAGDINIGSLFDGLFKLGGEFIEDKDKRNEYNMKVANAKLAFSTAIVTMKTVPWVDATVKLMYAFLPFFRPIGAVVAGAFAAYCDINDIALSGNVELMLYGAFPGWMASRGYEKLKGRDK